MTRMTFNLIMVSKNAQFGSATKIVSGDNPLDRIKTYVSHVTGVAIENIDKFSLRAILMDAICDYIDTCDAPSEFLNLLEMHGVMRSARYESSYNDNNPDNIYKSYASALMMIKIRNASDGNFTYINGFKEEYFKEWKDEYEW